MLNLNLEVVVLLLAAGQKHKTSQSTINGQSGQKTFTTETNSSEISDLLKGEKLLFYFRFEELDFNINLLFQIWICENQEC